MAQLDTALRASGQSSACSCSSPLPTWMSFSRVGRAVRGGSASPVLVCRRTKCFIDTVSPARSSVRSKTVCTRASGSGGAQAGGLAGTAKRQGSIPRIQPLKTKAMSTRPWASRWRAVTKRPSSPPHEAARADRAPSTRARPWASVRPCHSRVPAQSCTATSAPATGRARSSVVTQTALPSRPCLKCTPRLVTSTPVRTYIGAACASSACPSRRDSISITW